MSESWVCAMAVVAVGALVIIGIIALPPLSYLCARAAAMGWMSGELEFLRRMGVLPPLPPKKDEGNDE